MSSISPDKVAVTLVEFKFGDPANPSYARYTDNTSNETIGPATFFSTPEIEVKLPPSTGVFKEKELTIALPTDDFATAYGSGGPVSPCWVTVWERISGSVDRRVWYGRVTRAIRNYQGRRQRTLIEVSNLKMRLETAVGLMANHTCHHIFGGRGCRIIINPEVGLVTLITGSVVTITGLSAHVNSYWHRGYIWRNGIQVGIREWISGTSFSLTRRIPSSWLNQQVTVFPGCDRTIEHCRTIWNNEKNFGGIGYAIVARNPLFEKP